MRFEFSRKVEIVLLCVMLGCAGLLALKAAQFLFFYSVRDHLLEYREYAVILSTDLLLQGLNPYSIQLQPVAMNVYGIVYNVIVLPFAMVFGSSPAVHRIVSSFFIFATCGCLFWGLRASRVSWSMSAVGAITLFAFLATGFSIVSRPDSLGQFFMLAGIVVPFVFRYRPTGLALSVLLSMLGFLTKPYFILGAPFLAAYLFVFESKIKGLVYSLAVSLSLLLLIPLMHAMCETWLTNAIFNHFNNAVSGQYESVAHLRTQLWYHIQTLLGFIIALFWGIGYRAGSGQRTSKDSGSPLFNLRDLKQPLLSIEGDLPLFIFLCGLTIMVLKLGLHTGNGQLYYHQLVTPYFLWFVIRFLDGLPKKWRWATVLPIAVNLLALQLYYVPSDRVDFKAYWQALEQVVKQHKDIYHSPGLAYIISRNGRPVYNTGHNEYYAAGIGNNFTSVSEEFAARGRLFWQQVAEKAAQRKLDLIMQDAGANWPIDRSILQRNYNLVSHAYMPLLFNGNWPLELWLPKPEE